MRVLVVVLIMCMIFHTWGAEVSEDCKMGRADPDECCKDISSKAYLADSADCTKYYLCFNKKAMLLSCLTHRIYIAKAQRCVPLSTGANPQECEQKKKA